MSRRSSASSIHSLMIQAANVPSSPASAHARDVQVSVSDDGPKSGAAWSWARCEFLSVLDLAASLRGRLRAKCGACHAPRAMDVMPPESDPADDC